MHQNKPTAPITYLNRKGITIPIEVDTKPIQVKFTLKELALLQTLSNRSLINCNCNLDKKVMKSVVDNINKIVWGLWELAESKDE
jgi:hypothetical protein